MITGLICLAERRARERSIQHMVCSLDFLCQWHLASDASKRFSAGEAVSFLEARDLGFAVGGDHDGFIDSFVHAGFEKERHFVDDHSMGVTFGNPTHQSVACSRATRGWMMCSSCRSFARLRKTMLPRACRLRERSGLRTVFPNSLTISRQAGLPGFTTSWASSSASMTTAPHCLNILATVLLPVATPPVRPTRIMACGA